MALYNADLTKSDALGRVAAIFTAKDEVGEAAFHSIVAPAGAKVFSTRTQYLDDEPDENRDFQLVTPFDKVAENFPDTERLEDKLGVPMLTSTQVFAWDCLRLLGTKTMPTGFGKLFNYSL